VAVGAVSAGPLRAGLLGLLMACGGGDAPPPAQAPAPVAEDELRPFAPAPATMHRLTDPAWRASARDLLGVGYGGELPIDYRLYGYAAVGATEVSISPLDLELYEAAAWALARAAVPDAATRDARVGCALDLPPGATDADASAALLAAAGCVRAWTADLLRRAWRRPPSTDQLADMAALYADIINGTADPTLAVRGVVAATLLSPHFLFRVERGETDPDQPERRRYTSHEMASRLSYGIRGTTPDRALLDAADRGELTEDRGIRQQAERLLATREAGAHLGGFFGEMLDLDRLESAEKSPDLYPWDSPPLRAAMAEEMEALFVDLAVERDAPIRDLYTTRRAWLTHPDLAALYGLELSDDALPAWVDLPATADRGGLLGRAAFLTLNAHNSQTSPTRRGKAIRVRLLCDVVPPPPDDVVTSLDDDGSDEGTLRDRLEQHATDPACSGCHDLIDPLGYPLEDFGAMGEHRTRDNGLPIDASGSLDGVAVDGAAQMGAAMAAHPDVGPCFARNFWRFGTGRLEGAWQEQAVRDLGGSFDAADQRLSELVLALVLSESFRTVAAPAEVACAADDEGDTRPCGTACGDGEETCRDGAWVGCSAPAPAREVCDGEDNDCDDAIDEGVVRACDLDGVAGTQTCADGDWRDCATAPGDREVCNGEDDDHDGDVDEDLSVGLEVVTFDGLAADGHPSCDAEDDPDAPACRAAVNRLCAGLGCYRTGLGVVATDRVSGLATIACASDSHATVVETTFSHLSTFHGGCTATSRQSRDCNAAIHRFCGARGESSGFGPVENSGDMAVVVCTPGAEVVGTTYTELSTFQSTCDGFTWRSGPVCNTAFHQLCRSRGAETGDGPNEHSGDNAAASCVGGGD
jgi:hypothetical protein